jgi:hypothetical protein
LYVGKFDAKLNQMPAGFENDPNFSGTTGRIYKFTPTRVEAQGSLYPKEPEAPTKNL